MKKKTADLAISVVVIAVSVVLFISTKDMKTLAMPYELSQPGLYVRLWTGFMGILGVLLLVRTILTKSDERQAIIWHPGAIISVIVTIVYLLVLDFLGFKIATVLLLMALGLVYTYLTRSRCMKGKALLIEILRWLVISIIVTVVLYFLFGGILKVVLP